MENFSPSLFSILMVDDNPKNLQLLGSTLRNEGYQIEFATNGTGALSWVEKKIFDLILLDIMMPGMNGYEVCTEIRTKQNYSDTPIIFITAKTDKESLLQGFASGSQDYITKPFDSAELLARIKTHLELRYSKIQLKELNKTLEDKVEERTMQLKVANEQLQVMNEELLNLDKVKAEFLHIVAHEIRTPLNGIKGSLEIMKEQSTDQSIKRMLDILDASVTRLEKFSILALKITQLKIGKYEFDMQPLRCNLLIKTATTKVNNSLISKQLELEQFCNTDSVSIYGDFELLSQCLTIILDNAIKYSSPNRKIRLNSEIQNKNVVISVTDEGPGFSKKALSSLFKLFAPGERHVNENEGVELALVKLILDSHNGDIKIQNNPVGATVSIFLPIDNS